MLYEMVSGKMPFSGATTSHTIVQILEKDPLPLSKDVPAELERIVLKAIAKDPDERYQTAKDMLIDLRSLKKRLEVQAEIERTSSPSTERPAILDQPRSVTGNKRRLVITLVIVMLVVTAGIFGVNMWRSARERASAVTPTPPVPATKAERTLTYWITVQKFKDRKPYQDPFTLAGEINFEPTYQIRVNVRSPQPGHLYILNEGPGSTQPGFVILFPSITANDASSMLPAGQVVQIPEKSWFEFDQQQGTEKLWLVFSADPVPELESVKQYANRQAKGLIPGASENRNVQNFLATHSTSKPESERGETLTTLKTASNLLVYALRLEHH
jgi:serine/threonine protein kinase